MANIKMANSQQLEQLVDTYKKQVDIFELMLDEFTKNPAPQVIYTPAPIKKIPIFGTLYKVIRKFLIKINLYQRIKSSNIFHTIAETGIFVKLGR